MNHLCMKAITTEKKLFQNSGNLIWINLRKNGNAMNSVGIKIKLGIIIQIEKSVFYSWSLRNSFDLRRVRSVKEGREWNSKRIRERKKERKKESLSSSVLWHYSCRGTTMPHDRTMMENWRGGTMMTMRVHVVVKKKPVSGELVPSFFKIFMIIVTHHDTIISLPSPPVSWITRWM